MHSSITNMLIQLALIFFLVGETLSHNPTEQQVAANTPAISSVAKVRKPRQAVSEEQRKAIREGTETTNALYGVADMLYKLSMPIRPGAVEGMLGMLGPLGVGIGAYGGMPGIPGAPGGMPGMPGAPGCFVC
ncbi:unnamed protein product [Cylicocyclus nassatus]|uniref:Uncharacterized protein n=1 Tax=Cylicocyclus nassatus TaxID=53992 RepID=A0AA36DQW6_CYLNA|nr:unnamed protein product [Cylicocyclus nassatus]